MEHQDHSPTDSSTPSAAESPAAGDASERKPRRRIAISVLVVCLLAGGALVVASCLHPPTYTSEAWLMIGKQRYVLLPQSAPDDDQENFVRNQLEIIRSPRLLEPLVARHEIAATPELVREQDFSAALARQLKIRRKGETDIYIISFTSVSPEKAEIVLQAVVDAYLAFDRQQTGLRGDVLIESLKKMADSRYREMSQLREQVKVRALVLTGQDPFRPPSPGSHVVQRQLSELVRGLESEVIKLQVELELLAARIKAAEDCEAGAAESSQADSDQLPTWKVEHADTAARVKILQERINMLTQSVPQYSGDTLDLEDVRNKLAAVTSNYDALRNRMLQLATESGAPQRVDLYQDASRPLEPDTWWKRD